MMHTEYRHSSTRTAITAVSTHRMHEPEQTADTLPLKFY